MWVLLDSFFMFSNLYHVDSSNKTCVALANLRWNICNNRIEKSNLPWFSCGYGKCMFIDIWTGYTGPPNCVHYCVEQLLMCQDIVRSLLTTRLYDVCMWVLLDLFFMFSNLYHIDLHNKTCVANLQWNVCNNRIENRTSHDLVCGYRKYVFVEIWNGYTSPPNCVHYWV